MGGPKSGAHGGWRDEEVDSLPDTGIEEDLPPHRTLATAELHPRLKKPRMNSCCASMNSFVDFRLRPPYGLLVS
jgi:hypothetical protein